MTYLKIETKDKLIERAVERKFDAVVIGNVGVDTNIYFKGLGLDLTVESTFTENIDCVGQAGGYAARGFSRLSKRTAFIGYVGDDFNGSLIREEFSKDDIDTTGMFIDPAGTCRSVNLMFNDGTRKNFYDGKSHMILNPDSSICSRIISNSTLAHFNIPNWARHLLPLAKEAGSIISCDLQDMIAPDDNYREDFITYADIVFFSSVNHPDPTPLIQSLFRINPNLIVVAGMGSRGCAVATASEETRFIEAFKSGRPVIDTNGAGDALAVGFLSSLIFDGYDIMESIRRAQIVARHACEIRGSSSELITREELNYKYNRILE
jgi:sugar/nucleoside kinase (ribokinase family)